MIENVDNQPSKGGGFVNYDCSKPFSFFLVRLHVEFEYLPDAIKSASKKPMSSVQDFGCMKIDFLASFNSSFVE